MGHEGDLDRQLRFPTEITTTSLRPDIVVWSTKAKSVHLVELTVPMEEGIEAAFERKKAKYSDLAAEAGWLEDHHLSSGGWMPEALWGCQPYAS